jgi:hypothetical protein
MSKLICSVIGAMLLVLSGANLARDRFAKYKAVEAYEIRPGILMIPTYSADGHACEIGLERLHYSPEKIRLDSSLSRKEIDQIFDELVPSDERGPQPEGLLERGMTTFEGRGMVSDEQYQNVMIEIYGNASPAGEGEIVADEVVATLKWKNRTCQ